MQYIEAPSQEEIVYPSVFLCGGITGCPDWQSELCEMLKDCTITVLNPRRKDFPIGNPSAAEAQIRWEYKNLRRADVISFWFSRGSLNPIVLFELGAALERSVPVVVGIDGPYERKRDVEIQTCLRRPEVGVAIQYNLESLAKAIRVLCGF